MSNRTTFAVRFSSLFYLPTFAAPEPAGKCRIDHDEETIEGTAYLAWRRVGGAQGPTRQMAPVNPADLGAALLRVHKK